MKKIILLCLFGFFALSLQAADANKPVYLADKHTAKSIPCSACHGNGKEPEEPTLETCTTCHALDPLVEKTASVKPKNPHISPHYQNKLDCINCHVGHDEPVNFCGQCHNFDFKVK